MKSLIEDALNGGVLIPTADELRRVFLRHQIDVDGRENRRPSIALAVNEIQLGDVIRIKPSVSDELYYEREMLDTDFVVIDFRKGVANMVTVSGDTSSIICDIQRHGATHFEWKRVGSIRDTVMTSADYTALHRLLANITSSANNEPGVSE